MSFLRRIHPFCGIFWGIAMMLLLVCGQETSARTILLTEFVTPAAADFSAPPPPLQPYSDQWEASGGAAPQQAALSRDRLTFSPLPGVVRAFLSFRFRVLTAFPPANHGIPSLLEIRGMLPLPLAPPALLS